MKLPSFLLALASAASLLVGVSADGVNALQCLVRHPNAYHAINDFCLGNGHILVPSDYSKKGKHYGNIFVKIGGDSTCDPPQWVPLEYCKSQFFEVCVDGAHAHGKKSFGRNGCQSFHIGKITLAARDEDSAEEE